MPSFKEVFICQNCGTASPKWQGQCPDCGELECARRRADGKGPASRAGGRQVTTSSLATLALAEQARLGSGSGATGCSAGAGARLRHAARRGPGIPANPP